MRLASGILHTLPGVPCIYYGDEAGVEGYKDPFNRRTFPWGKEDKDLLNWYRELGKMRHACSCLVDGDIMDYNSDGQIMAFIRSDENDTLMCVFNSSDHEVRFRIPKEFIGGETFMNTVLDGDEVVMQRDDCAFVRIKTPEKPVISTETEEPAIDEPVTESADIFESDIEFAAAD